MGKSLFIILISILFSNILHAQNGWIWQNPKPSGVSVTSENLNDVFFTNSQNGFIAGANGSFLNTSNGGETWDTSKISTKDFLCIKFIDNNTGWLGGFQSLYKTTNGGANFIGRFAGSTLITDISFINSETGWFTSSPSGIYKTTNGGNNWFNIFSSSSYKKIVFIDSQTGWAAGRSASPDYIAKTTNGGTTWIEIPILENARTISFLNSFTGFIISTHYFSKTTNGGLNWINSPITWSNWEINDADFFDSENGYCVNYQGEFYKTTNGGTNWTSLSRIPSPVSPSAIYFASENVGWAVGASGMIIKTTTGGNVFVQQSSSVVPYNFSLHQNYPNPFNPNTVIRFQLPVNSFVNLKIFDIKGREVSELVNEKLSAGEYKIDFSGENLQSGIYFYKMTTENFSETRKMILVK